MSKLLGPKRFSNFTLANFLLSKKTSISNLITSVVDNSFYIYKLGNEFTGITGGFIAGFTYGNGSITKQSDRLSLSVSGNPTDNAFRNYETSNKIDLTNFSRIVIEWENINPYSTDASISKLFVSLTKGASGAPAAQTISEYNTFGKMVDALDVSNFNGTYYIAISAVDGNPTPNNPVSLNVYKIWCE